MIHAVVLAAGASSRYGAAPPKQEVLLPRVLAALARSESIDGVLVVTGAHEVDTDAPTVRCDDWKRGAGASLRCGLAALPDGGRGGGRRRSRTGPISTPVPSTASSRRGVRTAPTSSQRRTTASGSIPCCSRGRRGRTSRTKARALSRRGSSTAATSRRRATSMSGLRPSARTAAPDGREWEIYAYRARLAAVVRTLPARAAPVRAAGGRMDDRGGQLGALPGEAPVDGLRRAQGPGARVRRRPARPRRAPEAAEREAADDLAQSSGMRSAASFSFSSAGIGSLTACRTYTRRLSSNR